MMSDHADWEVVDKVTMDAMKAEIKRLRGIIVKWYEYWPEPWGEGRDGFEMQEFGEKHGILIGTEQTTPCSEGCNCAEYFGDGDVITCYRLAPEYLALEQETDDE
jgi:hypothetical protein